MKKLFLVISIVLISLMASAQKLSIDKPVYSKDGIRLELIQSDQFMTMIKYQSISMDGKILQEGTYLNGKPDGIWKMYQNDGTFATMRFKNGKKIVLETTIDGRKTKVYYDDNKPVKTIAFFD